jgi:pimeloyl-ACP methyl ester carboxylesterase
MGETMIHTEISPAEQADRLAIRELVDAYDMTTGRSENELPALGICFEEYAYPHRVKFVSVQNDLQTPAMAYMDVPPESESNGKTVVLMHGKAFGGYYFEHVIEALAATGYRVVVPDQIGWGKSSKPDIHYSFQLLVGRPRQTRRLHRALRGGCTRHPQRQTRGYSGMRAHPAHRASSSVSRRVPTVPGER